MRLEDLADLAILEEARARLEVEGHGDADLHRLLGVSGSTVRGWRLRTKIPPRHRLALVTIIMERLRPDEQRDQELVRRLDEILEKVGGIEEVRGLLQRRTGPLPGAATATAAGYSPIEGE